MMKKLCGINAKLVTIDEESNYTEQETAYAISRQRYIEIKKVSMIVFDMHACDDGMHHQNVIRKLGIKYKIATAQSISDKWWFWCPENIPNPLPKYLRVKDEINPFDYIGYWLSVTDAQKLSSMII
jgi:hypothetical protein